MRLYLDTCVFNRPFDPQITDRIRIESAASRVILEHISNGRVELIWSTILDIEIEQNPNKERRDTIATWANFSCRDISEPEISLDVVRSLIEFGLKKFDAFHVASAVAGNADNFVTTDDGVLKRGSSIELVNICSPMTMVEIIGD